MALELRPRLEVWTYAYRPPSRRSRRGAPPKRTIEAQNRLCDAVVEEVQTITFKERTPREAWMEAAEKLEGDALDRAISKAVHPNTLRRNLSVIEETLGLNELRATDNRPARALVLLAAEREFAPLAEGLLAGTDWFPASTRLDLRGVFHLLTRWWTQTEPRILSRLAVSALRVDNERFLPWRPLTALYQGVLVHHRAEDQRMTEAGDLSAASIRVLYNAYRNTSTKREIMQELFAVAEELKIIDPRPSFDALPERRRQLELTRIALDLEVGRPIERNDASLITMLAGELSG